MNKKVKDIGTVVLLYLLVIILISFIHYVYLRHTTIEAIDQQLETAIHSSRAIIGKDFHDGLQGEDSLTDQEDYQLAVKLYEFAQTIDVEYIYSFIKFDDEILFALSSATEDEIALETYEPAYLTQYPEMDEAVAKAFETGSIQTAEYHDRWGTFRSVFIPFDTQSGEVYVMGADISTNKLKSMVWDSVVYAFMVACFLALLITPAVYMLFKSMRREWQVKYQSMFKDELTGLPNRNQLMRALKASEDTHLALIDIKKFNDVTNTFGPAVADSVTQQFACRLNNFSHSSLSHYQAYRISGDVFAIHVNQRLDGETVKVVSQLLIDFLENHQYKVNSTDDIRLTVTIGGVNQNDDAYMLANMALDEAKKNGVQTYVYDNKSTALPATYQTITRIKKQLQLAFDENRLVPFFQPIYSAKDQELAKYECLARIVDDSGQIELTPDLFIPVARRARMYSEITQRMLSQSIKAAQHGQFIVSINLSISDIMDAATRSFIYRTVNQSKIASRIQFEILETEAIEDLVKVRQFITKLQRMGSKVGIDDLGRSYSNFDRLSILPVDFIKIDGSIITSIENDKEAQAITSDIVKLAHKHQIKVTAEYCHNQATTDMAVKLGVDYLQGFHLGVPDITTK